MSSVGGAQLLAEGPQDEWLSGNPQVSFFRSMYRHSVPFGIELKKMNFEADGSCRFDRYGDLLGACHLTAHDKVTGQLVPLTSWAGIIDSVELVIGGQLVDTQDYTYSSQVWPVLEASTWSQRAPTPTGFYPLHFFFCQDWSRAFPLCTLKYHDLSIRIKTLSSTYTIQFWATLLHLSEQERSWFIDQPHRLLITQTQRTLITPDQNEFQRFAGPLKYLATQVLDYQRLYTRITAPTPVTLDTTTTQTYTVSYYNPYNVPIAWTVLNALPAGVTVASYSDTQLVFTIAAGSLVTSQTFQVSVTPVPAYGGDTVQDIGSYRIHTFMEVGTSTFTAESPINVEVLVVAGGGGGGYQRSNQSGGGGGAGELIYRSSISVNGTTPVTVGAGGLSGIRTFTIQNSTSGANSVFGSLTALGGGRGGNGTGAGRLSGGSGGGAERAASGAASTATLGLGNAGGSSLDNNSTTGRSGGGGGGATSVGQSVFSSSVKTPGGTGYTSSISGTSRVYAAGGAGGARNFSVVGADAAANSGSGGGGADGEPSTGNNGGSGGSGIVIVRYPVLTLA